MTVWRHWLGLKHIWGDADCGDDGVADTPQQSNFTSGCPRGTHISCGNASTGDMYMNFMDYTNDPCMNLFTKGQSDRMRALFEEGGAGIQFYYPKPWVNPMRHKYPVLIL
ncbi:MAG: hypothetical protein JSS70_04600 [Bacteroidetes bacterium]|nr:hypothetical protein [Bacteroidota bacterium]